LDDDQLRVVQAAKEAGRTTNRGVQGLLGVSRATATRLLDVLVAKGVFARRGKTGRAAHYVLKNLWGQSFISH